MECDCDAEGVTSDAPSESNLIFFSISCVGASGMRRLFPPVGIFGTWSSTIQHNSKRRPTHMPYLEEFVDIHGHEMDKSNRGRSVESVD